MRKIVSFLLFALLSITSCKVEKTYFFLGEDYWLLKSNNTTEEWDNIVLKEKKNKYIPVIPPEVINYNFNKEIVIIKQKFDSVKTANLLKKIIVNEYEYFTLSAKYSFLDNKSIELIKKNPRNEDDNLIISIISFDQKIKKLKNNEFNYFLIIKKDNRIEGPLSREDFYKRLNDIKSDLDFE